MTDSTPALPPEMLEQAAEALKPFLYDLPGPDLHVQAAQAALIAAGLPELMEEVERLRNVGEWKPISLAPKDGSHILVYYEVASVPIAHIAHWEADEYDLWSEQGFESKADAVGWWAYTRNSVSQEKLEGFRLPRFWMLLPTLPASGQVMIGGLQVVVDPTIPSGEMHIRDSAGNVLGKLVTAQGDAAGSGEAGHRSPTRSINPRGEP